MKSSDERRLGTLTAWGVVVVGVLVVALCRPSLTHSYGELRLTSDVLKLPKPEQTKVLTLGYRSAAAGMLYADMLVSYGMHMNQKRRFEFAGQYCDTINALAPEFRDPYLFADTVITAQPQGTMTPELQREAFFKAREVLERGTRNLPLDTEVWYAAGLYTAYFVPPHLDTAEEVNAWKLAGAKMLQRACMLVDSNDNIPYHCILAASLLERGGQREASIRFAQRMLAITDDPGIAKRAELFLKRQLKERELERTMMRMDQFEKQRREDLYFVGKDQYLVVGPPFDAARCAGLSNETPQCATSWRAWFARRLTSAD